MGSRRLRTVSAREVTFCEDRDPQADRLHGIALSSAVTVDRPRICFFPGLGCDERVVEPHRPIHARIETQQWLAPRRNEALSHYARRMAEQIDTSTPFFLAGISFGGMVALEAASVLQSTGNVRGVILVAACRSYRGVPLGYRLATWFAARSPIWLVKLAKIAMPHMRRLFGIREASDVALFEEMLRDADAAYIRWCLGAVLGWKGEVSLDVPVFQIHGDRDYVLPLALAGPVDVVVEGAGHALNVSHSEQVNASIDEWLRQHSAALAELAKV
jgi:pimeloyl-ACP methyl ester carboxylesterase